MSPKSRLRLWVWFALALFLSGCSTTYHKQEQPLIQDAVFLDSSKSIGQTFSAHFDGLAGVTFQVDPIETSSGEILFYLRQNPLDPVNLRTDVLDLNQISASQPVTFSFEPLADSARTNYYLEIELNGKGQVKIASASPPDFQFGALYINGNPQDSQLSFSLLYQGIQLWLGVFREIGSWLIWILAGLFLYVLPGWALLRLTWPGWTAQSNWVRLGLAGGVGLAVYPVLFLFSDIFGFRFGSLLAFLPCVLALVFLVWINHHSILHALGHKPKPGGGNGRLFRQSPFQWAEYFLVGLILLVFFTRFWAIRTIDVPMWGDSIQHTVMAQLILNNQGLFSNWEPYAPYHSLTVHFGFPVHVAIFSWLTGLPIHSAALITSQWINAFAVVALIPLASRITPKSRWGALGSVLAAGLLSQTPAFYMNWGRFAQLDGQVVLPAAIWLTWEILDQTRQRVQDTPSGPSFLSRVRLIFTGAGFWIPILVIGMTLAGMTLSYYRMIFYYAAFFPALWFAWLLSSSNRSMGQWAAIGMSVVSIGISSLIFLLPWFSRVMDSSLSGMVAEGISNGGEIESALVELQGWRSLGVYLPSWLILVSILALVWSVIRRDWEVTAIGLWAVFLQVYQFGRVLQFPGANMLQVFAIMIWIYLPAAQLFGWLLGRLFSQIHKRSSKLAEIGFTTLVILLAVSGANQTRQIAVPQTYNMVTPPDLQAMEWIRENSSVNSRFLVETWRIYDGRSAVGTDAGWWIPLLAARKNTMPPQYALLNEIPEPADYSQRIVNLAAALEEKPLTDPANLELLCTEEITHIYIGQRWGNVGAGTGQLINPTDLLKRPEFDLVYHQDRVYIFKLDDAVCEK